MEKSLSDNKTLKHIFELKELLKVLKTYFWFVSTFLPFSRQFFFLVAILIKISVITFIRPSINTCILQVSVGSETRLSKDVLWNLSGTLL